MAPARASLSIFSAVPCPSVPEAKGLVATGGFGGGTTAWGRTRGAGLKAPAFSGVAPISP